MGRIRSRPARTGTARTVRPTATATSAYMAAHMALAPALRMVMAWWCSGSGKQTLATELWHGGALERRKRARPHRRSRVDGEGGFTRMASRSDALQRSMSCVWGKRQGEAAVSTGKRRRHDDWHWRKTRRCGAHVTYREDSEAWLGGFTMGKMVALDSGDLRTKQGRSGWDAGQLARKKTTATTTYRGKATVALGLGGHASTDSAA
jgi:hypothetical protein